MAARKPRSPSRRTRRRERREGLLSQRPAVWLATLSTVVGVATGMFTLRDQVFPGERGTAGALGSGAYRAHVGRICDALNESDRARRRDDRRLGRELASARTVTTQRDALLDSARRSASRSSHTLAEFAGTPASPELAPTQRKTVAYWRRNLNRVLSYVEQLDRAGDRKDLMAAVNNLSLQRSALARDGQRINEGLERLGAESCDIDPPVVTKTINLPAAPTPRPSTPRPAPASQSTATATATATATPAAQISGPRVNPPTTTNTAPSAPETTRPRVNTPGTAGPVTGGGEDG